MPISNEFVCPNKHSFKAVAKLRARCPDCGLMARRNFEEPNKSTQKTMSKNSFHSTTSTSQSSGASLDREEESKTLEDGSVNASKPKKQFVRPKPKVEKSKPTVIRRGKMPQPEKKKFIVKRKLAPSHAVIAVKRSPNGSRERKIIEAAHESEPFWVGVKRKYFR